MRLSHKITITVGADNLEENTNPDVDTFYANKQTASRIMNIANEENVPIEKPIYLKEVKRFKSKELAHLANNISTPFYKKYNEEINDISLFLASNPYSEIENVAMEIVKLVKKGYKYEDISVITKNIDTYSNLCIVIFSKYNIPVFIDEKKDFSSNILVKYILSILEVLSKNWSYEAIFSYIKTGFLNLDEQQQSLLENYVIKWGIKGSKWYAKEWKFYDETEEEQKQILYSKEQVVTPLLEFKKSLQGLKTVKDISSSIYEFLIENNISEKLKEKIQYLKEINELEKAKEYEKSFEIFIQLLDEIVLVLGEQNITFEKYAKILKMGFTQSHLGVIPEAADQVIVGDVDRSRSHKIKVSFLIGLNDGIFPAIQKDEGFLDDDDRQELKQQGIELAKGTMEKLYDDNFNIYKAFSTAEEKLYLSYVSSDAEGKSLRPSIIINKIKRVFPKVIEESDVVNRKSENTTFDELLIKLRDLKEGKKIDPIWLHLYDYYFTNEKDKLESALKAIKYQNVPDKIQKENINKLYGNTLKTSISRLEKYKSCAFSYYLKYGLKLKETNSFSLLFTDTSTTASVDVSSTKQPKASEIPTYDANNKNENVKENDRWLSGAGSETAEVSKEEADALKANAEIIKNGTISIETFDNTVHITVRADISSLKEVKNVDNSSDSKEKVIPLELDISALASATGSNLYIANNKTPESLSWGLNQSGVDYVGNTYYFGAIFDETTKVKDIILTKSNTAPTAKNLAELDTPYIHYIIEFVQS